MAKQAARAKHDTTGKPWARYLRLSKKEGEEVSGSTREERLAWTNAKLDEHLVEMTRWLDATGLPYREDLIFRDAGLSAYKPGVKRPGWDEMMALAESGDLAGIGIVAVDRFTRDVTTMEALIRLAETTAVNIGGPRAGNLDLTTYQGIQQARGMAMQAANESLATSHRLRETLARKMAAGKPMGSGRSFGYETGGEVHRPDEVAVVREMAARMLAGEPLQTLAAEMNERGLATTRGGPWTGANLGRMLGLSRYGGLVTHKGQIVGTMKGEPVLDRDTYDSVRALLTSRRRGRRPTGRFMLTGLLTCSTCQVTMNGATRTKVNVGNAEGPRVYRCPVQRGGCGRVILAEGVEKRVGEHMIGKLSDPLSVEKIVAENVHLNTARAAQLARLQAVEDRLIDLEVKWAAGELIQAAYDRSKPVLDGQRAKLLAGLEELSPAAAITSYDASTDWKEMTDDEQRRVIRDYRVRIEILPMQPGTRRFDPNRVGFPA